MKATAVIQPAPYIEIELGGAVVRVGRGVDAEVLRTVIDALRGPAR